MSHEWEEDIVPNVTEGHDIVHEELAEWWNLAYYVSDTGDGADIADALAEAHAKGRGRVVMMGTDYDMGDAPVALLITLPTISLEGAGSAATVLNYSGDGVCIKVEPDPFTVTQMGELRGFTVDGTGAGDGAVGIHQVNTGTTMPVPDVVVQNFTGVESVGHRIENSGTPSWNERATGERHHLNHNTIGLQLIGDGLNNSIFYAQWAGMRINLGEDQIGIQTKGTALLQGGHWEVVFNADGSNAVFWDLADTSAVGGHVECSGEQTTGTGSVGRRIAAGAVWAASGTLAFNGAMGPDEIDGALWPPCEIRQGGQMWFLFPDPPSVSIGVAAGSSPPAPTLSTDPTSNDIKGVVFGGTGTGTVVGELFEVTYAHPYSKAPVPVVTAFGIQAAYVRHFISAISETGFTIAVADALPEGLGAYDVAFLYHVLG